MDELKVNLFRAYYLARKNKRNTYNQLKFEINYETELWKLYEEIIDGTYKVGKSIAFVVNEPVKREIFAASFRDRVMHHLLFLYINPVVDQHFIEDCYSCRKNKGTHYGIKRAEQYLEEASLSYTKDTYILKLDIQGFFMAIDKNVLIQKITDVFTKESFLLTTCGGLEDITYEMLLELLEKIIFNDPIENCIIKGNLNDWTGLPADKSLFSSRKECGLPIGNLTSQLFSNVYLNDFDHYVKNTLKIEYYGRYVDDFYFMHSSKDYLKKVRTICEEYLLKNHKVKIHPKKIFLQHYTKGFPFLGTYIKPYRTYIGKRTRSKFKRLVNGHTNMMADRIDDIARDELITIRDSLNSYLGLMKHYKTYRFRNKTLFSKYPNSYYNYGFFDNHLEKYVLYAVKKYKNPL